MAGPGESDGGCLSVLSCFKSRGTTRPEGSKSPKQAPASASPAAKVSQGSAPSPTPTSRPVVEAPALLPIESSTKSKDEVALPTQASNPASPTTGGPATTLDLWREAYDEVDDDTRKWIGDIPAVTNVKDSTQELANLVRVNEEKYKQETPKLKVGDREILWRDYADRVVSWLTTIGDIAITFAPAPSSAVWSAANVSQCKDLVAILGCTDIVLCLARRGRVYEEVYIGESPSTSAQEDMKQKLVSVYKTCLEFLAFVDTKFKQRRLGQFLDALLDPGNGEQRVSDVRDLEFELALAAQACEAESSLAKSDEQQKLLQSLQGPLKRIDDRVMAMLKKVEDAELRKVMNFISEIPVGAHHNEKLESRTHGTCEWVAVSIDPARLGMGKSFLSSKVIDRYRINHEETKQWSGQHDEGFAFFYCSRFDPARRNFKNILRSYIRQLSEVPRRSARIHEAPYNIYQKAGNIQNDISLKDCEATLEDIINSYPRTTLVLDALDECEAETRRQIAEFFQHLIKKTTRLLKVFLASRKEVDIERHLESFQGPQMLVQISTSDNRSDIEKFVVENMAKHAVNWEGITEETKQLVKETLVKKSDGMFRWTYLQWEQLKVCNYNGAVRQRLERLPKTLSGAYDEIYNRYDPEDSERVMLQRTVRWVLCARKPLDSCTLLSAIRLESEKMDGARAFDRSDLTEQTLESVCSHLVVKDSELDVWKFPHASVAEYFGNKKEPWIESAQAEVAEFLISCLMDCCSAWPPPEIRDSQLSEWEFWRQEVDPNKPLDARHPLQGYIEDSWFRHIMTMSDQDTDTADVAQTLKRFLGEEGPQQPSREYRVFCDVMLRHLNSSGNYRNCITPADNSTFGVVAFGLHRALAGWWDLDLDRSLVNSYGQDLLAIAAQFGHIDLCEDLLARGFDVNKHVQWTRQSALGAAIDGECIEVARLFLKKGADPNRVLQDDSLLCSAVAKGDEYVQALLEAGADPNIKCDCPYGSALATAAMWDHAGAVRTLIQKGAAVNPDSLGGPYGSPLAAVAYCGILKSVRLLIEHGADANACLKSGDFGSPLVAAIVGRKLDCARLLIEHGADVDACLEFGIFGSPLVAAIVGSTFDYVRLLIEHGANANAYLKSGEYGSPLVAAVVGSTLDCVRLLVEHGANVNARIGSGCYASVLGAAVASPLTSLARVRFLVEEAKADPMQLTWGHPMQLAWGQTNYDRAYRQDHRQEVVAYLIQECHIKAQVLIDYGVPLEYIPSVLLDNARDFSTVPSETSL
ncbi:hypothetical protein NM208_g2322 [Fusarium decemcellulare]|uniref:Uncharacterized protein n=1 Tax=Fusarium decemcellulare TaxID=57161 RepID=A0ACC1SSU9_9HYPO|nr:hypothetical protein NM208_g2322 [Fusarium decemcellulare]